jgi:tRNA 2-thiouridine synthesizing protein A
LGTSLVSDARIINDDPRCLFHFAVVARALAQRGNLVHIAYDCRFGFWRGMTEKTIDLRGLKCPLPALRARKALAGLKPGDLLVAECTDPLSAIDMPNLANQTGDKLESSSREGDVLVFRIRKS